MPILSPCLKLGGFILPKRYLPHRFNRWAFSLLRAKKGPRQSLGPYYIKNMNFRIIKSRLKKRLYYYLIMQYEIIRQERVHLRGKHQRMRRIQCRYLHRFQIYRHLPKSHLQGILPHKHRKKCNHLKFCMPFQDTSHHYYRKQYHQLSLIL